MTGSVIDQGMTGDLAGYRFASCVIENESGKTTMFKTLVSVTLAASTLAACSSASGPTFNAYAIDLADGTRAYRVECHGLFEPSNACMRAAQRVCGDRTVQPLDRQQRLSEPAQKIDDPGAMTFRCEAAS